MSEEGAAPRPRKCPTCGKPATPSHRPFCSKRCADIDFGRWLGGAYVIPATPGEDDDDEEAAAPAGKASDQDA